jgi:GT2 family glycosyltransferase
MMARAEAIDEVGLLDEQYHMYCEEIDWCWRMRQAGWRAWCAPAAAVVHHGGRSSEQVPIASFLNLWQSRARLYAQHQGPVSRAAARVLVQIGMRRRARSASPEMRAACQQVRRAWSETA